MAFTFHATTILTSKNSLTTLTHLLTLSQSHSIPPETRLAPDMRPLSSQIHLLCQAIQRMLSRIHGTIFVPPVDDLVTYEDMHARIRATVADLDAMDAEFVNERADVVEETFLAEGLTKRLSAADFVLGASMPNVYFHLNMVYAILRVGGVGVGKWDYIQGFMGPVLERGES